MAGVLVLDLVSESVEHQTQMVDRLISLGAQHIDVGQPKDADHVVLSDPESNEFCVVLRGDFLATTDLLGAIVFEPGDPVTGRFWGEAIGWPLVYDQDGDTAIRAPDGKGPFVTFGPPGGDAKKTKNRFVLQVVILRSMLGHEHREDRFGVAEQTAEWDARYSERDGAMWSGRPNGRLVAEVGALTPGRVLDVGCGEGADAVWLAQRGWTVTAIDVSDVAVSRAREAGLLNGAAVEWVCGDALQVPFSARSFDLVSMQYPALPRAAGEAAIRTLLNTVRPRGLLLAVYHDLDDDHREHMKARGVDPADYIDADDLVRLLGDGFTVELHAVEPRVDPPPATPHIADIILRARRR